MDNERHWRHTQASADPNVKLLSDVLKKILRTFRLIVIATNSTSLDTKTLGAKRTAERLVENVKKRGAHIGKIEICIVGEEGSTKGDDLNVTTIQNERGLLTTWQMPVTHRFVFSKYFPSPVGGNLKGQSDKSVTVKESDLFSISSCMQQDNVNFKIVAGGIDFI